MLAKDDRIVGMAVPKANTKEDTAKNYQIEALQCSVKNSSTEEGDCGILVSVNELETITDDETDLSLQEEMKTLKEIGNKGTTFTCCMCHDDPALSNCMQTQT